MSLIDLQVGVNGRSDLQSKLDALKKKATKKNLIKALVAGGKVIKEAVEIRMPVRTGGEAGSSLPPGALRQDIHIKIKHADTNAAIVLVGPGKKTVLIAYDVEFGHFVRMSGGLKVIRKGALKFVPAKPVWRPAWEASSQQAMQAVIESLQNSKE